MTYETGEIIRKTIIKLMKFIRITSFFIAFVLLIPICAIWQGIVSAWDILDGIRE